MLAVLVPSSISAHAQLERSDPAAGARLAAARIAIDSQWGAARATQLAGGMLALIGFLLARRRRAGWILAAFGGGAIAIGASLGGHAGASERLRALGVLADALHVAGGAGWLGTLLWLVLSLRAVFSHERGLATMVNAFSPVALAFAALLTTTGLVSAWLRLGTIPALWSSAYGQVLLVKLALLAGVALVGLYNWRRMRPAIDGGVATPRFFRSSTMELAFGVAVISVTAVLVATPTP